MQYLTVKQAAERLQVHQMTIYRFVKRGDIAGCRIGGRWRFHPDQLDKFLTDKAEAYVTAKKEEIGANA